MKAIDLVVKLNEAILKYGSDCDVRLLEGIVLYFIVIDRHEYICFTVPPE